MSERHGTAAVQLPEAPGNGRPKGVSPGTPGNGRPGGGLRQAMRGMRSADGLVRAMAALPWGGAVILRYHSVNDDPVWAGDYIQKSLVVHPDVFDRQVAFLARRHRVVALDELVRAVRAGRQPDRRAVAITFDDGYEDNCRLALPILAKHGATATFYVTTGAVDDREVLWPVGLRRTIRACRAPSLEFGFAGSVPIDVSTDRNKEKAIRFLTGLVKRCGETTAEDVLAEIDEACGGGSAEPGMRIMMNRDEVRKLHESGMTVGAHTVKHYNMPSLDAAVLEREVLESKRVLEEIIEAPVEHFAYPNGRTARHCNAPTAEAVASAGFRSAVTSVTGPASPRFSPYCLPRLGVVPSDRDLRRFAADIQYARLSRPRNGSLDEICRVRPPLNGGDGRV
jgi:peptidoglycan/xylan/chitin deacetylase (PgdA/CDA1 family)